MAVLAALLAVHLALRLGTLAFLGDGTAGVSPILICAQWDHWHGSLGFHTFLQNQSIGSRLEENMGRFLSGVLEGIKTIALESPLGVIWQD